MATIKKITPELIQRAYDAFASGATRRAGCEMIGITSKLFYIWKKEYPAFKDAVEKGEADFKKVGADGAGDEVARRMQTNSLAIPLLVHKTQNEEFIGPPEETEFPEESVRKRWQFVAGYLPPELKPLWEALATALRCQMDMGELWAKIPRHHKQHIFLFAFTETSFDATKACLFVGINKIGLNRWIKQDKTFAIAWKMMQWHKKNVIEACLIRACVAGNAGAIVFASKTLNASRGYRETAPVQAPADETEIKKTTVPISTLDLPFDTKKQLLEAIRKTRQEMDKTK